MTLNQQKKYIILVLASSIERGFSIKRALDASLLAPNPILYTRPTLVCSAKGRMVVMTMRNRRSMMVWLWRKFVSNLQICLSTQSCNKDSHYTRNTATVTMIIWMRMMMKMRIVLFLSQGICAFMVVNLHLGLKCFA